MWHVPQHDANAGCKSQDLLQRVRREHAPFELPGQHTACAATHCINPERVTATLLPAGVSQHLPEWSRQHNKLFPLCITEKKKVVEIYSTL